MFHNTSSSPSIARSVSICISFIIVSTWCTLYNKYIFLNVFSDSNCLLLVQNLFALVCLLLGRAFGKLDFPLTKFSANDWLTGTCYTLNVMTGLWSLVYVNIAMFSALKRCTVVVSWAIEFWFTRTPFTVKTLPSLLLMGGGTMLASFYDLQFSLFGYALSMISCVMQGAAFELGKRTSKNNNNSLSAVLYVNSIASIVLLSSWLLVTGDIVRLDPSVLSAKTVFHFALNSVSCLAMNYIVFLNCSVNSPLAHAVTGNMKAVATTTLGLLMFATPMLSLGYVGLTLNFLGAGWFSYVKLQQSHAAHLQKAAYSSGVGASSNA